MVKINGRYGRILRVLYVHENIEEPYAHTFSLRVPGCLLSKIKWIDFTDLDWVTKRPHTTFFTYLTYFATFTTISLRQCCFRHVDAVRTIARSLPSLDALVLSSITIQSAPPALQITEQDSLPATTKLRVLRLYGSVNVDYPSGTASIECLHHSVLNALVLYQNTEELWLDTTQFFSFPHLVRFLYAFPAPRHIQLYGEPDWELPSLSPDGAVLRTPAKDITALTGIGLARVSSAFAMVFFKEFANQCPKLQELEIELVDSPSPTLQATITKVLQQSGAILRKFMYQSGNPTSSVSLQCLLAPPPLLSYSTGLETLTLDMPFALGSRSVSRIYRILLSLFSQVRSPRLKSIEIRIRLQDLDLVDLATNTDTTGSETITPFHTAISCDKFANLRALGAALRFRSRGHFTPDPSEATPLELSISAAIRSFSKIPENEPGNPSDFVVHLAQFDAS
ncbi:uncharacterized protein B0H18DRAFT_1125802 [Fomitopsis serialis]|uniref:uncharacterized protein n=1 Tax=Fomitopsis serialis TaxID=139415 RepID=UPI002008C09B|nr:uncharacterized protein B0H18DRAFT_1125802 [Neoantrodia serialis]KAH9914133.1 hypothetical protein B0H18DRAFT_1125802 [Neoantrodia serialis]